MAEAKKKSAATDEVKEVKPRMSSVERARLLLAEAEAKEAERKQKKIDALLERKRVIEVRIEKAQDQADAVFKALEELGFYDDIRASAPHWPATSEEV